MSSFTPCRAIMETLSDNVGFEQILEEKCMKEPQGYQVEEFRTEGMASANV